MIQVSFIEGLEGRGRNPGGSEEFGVFRRSSEKLLINLTPVSLWFVGIHCVVYEHESGKGEQSWGRRIWTKGMGKFWATRTSGRTPKMRNKIKTLKNSVAKLRSAAAGKGELQQGHIGTEPECRGAGASAALITVPNETLINQST